MGADWVFCRGSLVVWVSLAVATVLLTCQPCDAHLYVPSGYSTIQAAINAAANGEVIVVAAGRYRENIDFKGKAITVESTHPSDPSVVSQTVIDGNQRGSVVSFVSGETASSVLSGFTITNGNGNYDTVGEHVGGGVLCTGSSPTLTHNIISGNAVSYSGGGVACRNSASPTLSSNVISGNAAGWDGGGVWCEANSSPLLSQNTICDNSADDGGGGVACSSDSSATIASNVISGNSAHYGAGVFCWSSSPHVSHNTIRDNSAVNEGGGVYCDEYSSPDLANNVIFGNSSELGAGVFIYASSPTLTNETITGNLARQAGGGVYCCRSAPVVICNTIIALNTGGGLFVAYEGTNLTVRYCDVWGNSGANWENWPDQTGTSGNISADPLFVAGDDYRLQSQAGHWNGTAWVNDAVTSPCVDAGDPTSAYANEPAPNGGCINMGFDGNTTYASKGVNHPPTRPIWVTISPSVPGKEDLTGTTDDSTDPDGNPITYEYQWVKLDPAGGYLTKWADNSGQVLPASKVEFGETWQVRARAFDGIAYSAWKAHKTVTITRMVNAISPAAATTNVPLTSRIDLTFKWSVDQLSVNRRLRVYCGTALVHGSAKWLRRNQMVRFVPTKPLRPGTDYQVRLASGVECLSGRVLDWSEEYSFRTGGVAGASAVSVAAAPTAVGAQLTVNLSGAAMVRTVICNIAGRVVAELPQRNLPAGLSSLLWNGKGNSGTTVPAGTYLVRVQARQADGIQATALTAVQLR